MAEREDLCGRTLGEFVLRERIGEGGFGAVYRCEQPLLGREAVVKVLHQRLRRNDIVLQRFMREAQLASRLDHPYAAHVYAFGIEHDDGLFWIAMEMVQGIALNRWLRERGPLPLEQLVPFFECVAQVVQTAHDRGIVHRDLKPSNVMVIERAGQLLPKLLDFGIAKALDDTTLPTPVGIPRSAREDTQPSPVADGDRAVHPSEVATLTATTAPPEHYEPQHRLTHADSTIGSPPYMSPEQWNNAVTVGPSSDLYALGVMAYEAMTGRRPFAATTLAEYSDLHCHATVPALGDGLPPALDRWFERALAKRPDQRWPSAIELAAALRVASGLGGSNAVLPQLDDAVLEVWLADAPQPLAESVAAFDGARNPYQARDAAHDLLRTLLRYLLVLALATRAQVRDDRDDPTLLDLVRAMRRRDLTAGERVRLIRLLVRPLIGRRGAHPIPELVDLVTPRDDDADDLDPLLAMQPASDPAGAEDAVRSWLAQIVPELGRALRRLAFVLDYVLVVPRRDGVERWTGRRRQRRTLATVHTGELVEHHPMLLDRRGRVCVDLWPLVQVVSPSESPRPELFMFCGRGRHGARMLAAPVGYEHHDPSLWDWIANEVLAEIDDSSAVRREDRPPYLGLAPYAVGDAKRFVGRETEVEAFLDRLRERPLQVVVGPSGTGKSSFVHAGVLPGLPRSWRAVTLRPGAAPLATLAARLAEVGVTAPDLATLFVTSPVHAAARVAQAATAGTIVIVLDQLEELFTLGASRDERSRFAAAIAQLAASADLPIRVIATIRDDFLAHLEALPPLRAQLPSALVLLGNPSRDDLVRILVEPARRAGYVLSDPELAHDMVAAVADQPGALALVSFTALRLWELRDRRFRQLTRNAYDAMGGVAGALVRHAEATFERLAADEQRVAREIFRNLVTAEGARASLAPSELRQRIATGRVGIVLDKLIAARLIAMSDIEGESHVEIIHDALLDAWPRLQRWTREDIDGARIRDQLRIAARQWNDRVRPRGLLWRDDVLADLERWLRRDKPIVLTDLEASFVTASRRLARRACWARRSVLIFTLAVVSVFAVFQYRAMQTNLAREAAEAHLIQAYVERGRDALLEGKSSDSLAFLTLAMQRGGDSAMVRFMRERAAHPLLGELGRLHGAKGRMWWATFSCDGQQIVTSDDAGARIWDARSMLLLHTLPHGDIVYQAAFVPDGTAVVTVGADGFVKVWDARTGGLKASLHRERGSVVQYGALAISPDGGKVAVVDATGAITDVWDLRANLARPIRELVNDADARNNPSLEFSRDGRWFAVSGGGDVRVYDTTTWKALLTIPGPEVMTLAFDPTGPRLATGSWRGDVSIWAIPSGSRVHHLRESGDRIHHVAFSPDGALLVAAVADGANRIWNTMTGELEADLKSHRSAALWAEFDPMSRLVVSADVDGTVAISDVALRMTVSHVEGARGSIGVVHFDPSSQRVLGASWDGTARIWDAKWSYRRWGTLPIGDDCGKSVRADPDRRFLAIACTKHGTQVWDTARERLLAELPSPAPAAGDSVAARPAVDEAGERAAIATANTVTIYELPGGRIRGSVRVASAVTTVAFAAKGHDLVIGTQDGTLLLTHDGYDTVGLIRLPAAIDVVALLPGDRVVVADARGRLGVYSAASRARLTEIDLSSRIAALRWSADGRRLIAIPTIGDVQPVVLCDLERYQVIEKLDAHKAPVFSAKFVQGDSEVLTAGTDGAARLWDAETGRLRKAFVRSSPYLMDAAIDPTGGIVVTAGGDGVLRFWDASSARMIWSLRTHVARVAGLHFEGNDIITRGFTGELARWTLASSPELSRRIDRIAQCLPRRFDEETGVLVEQDARCDR